MSAETTKTLTNRARIALRNILEFPGAVEDIADAFQAGRLAATIDRTELFPREGEPDAARVARLNAWFVQTVPTEITPAQVAVVKKALALVLATKKFGASEELTELIAVLGLAD